MHRRIIIVAENLKLGQHTLFMKEDGEEDEVIPAEVSCWSQVAISASCRIVIQPVLSILLLVGFM